MSAPDPLLPGVIQYGDIVAVKGDLEFARGLARTLGEGVGFLRNADLDRRADFHASVEAGRIVLTQPKRRDERPILIDEDARPDHSAYVVHVSETARQGDHLCSLAPVVLEALSPTFARVLRVGGRPIANTALRLIAGQVVKSSLAPTFFP